MTDFLDRLSLFIIADATNATRVVKGFGSSTTAELAKVEGTAGLSGGRAGGLFASAFTGQTALIAQGLSATLGTIGAGLFAKSAVGDAIQLERATASLNAIIGSTGGTANVTSSEIERLAGGIQKTDAIFSGTAKAGAALLLTFDQVKNTAGAGNDVFNRTLNVSAALSNVLGKDLNTAVLQLGRALENPQAGMQALSRSGVALSNATRQQVLALAKQGDLLGAQKVLLTELEKRYTEAGAAIAKSDPFQQFSVSAKEFKTQVGEDLLPALTPLLDFADGLLKSFGALPAPIRDVVEYLGIAALSVVPLLKLKGVLDAISLSRAASAAGGTGAAAAQTAAVEAEATATTAAAAAQAELNTQLTLFSTEAPAAAAASEAVAVSATSEAGATSAAGLSLGAIVPVLAGVAIGWGIVDKATSATHLTFKELSNDVPNLAKEINKLETGSTSFGSRALDFLTSGNPLDALSKARQTASDVKELNNGLIQILDTQGVDAAEKAYNDLLGKFSPQGVDAVNNFNAALGPFQGQLSSAIDAMHQAAVVGDDLNTSFDALLGGQIAKIGSQLDVSDAINSVHLAVKKVNDDKADIAGTSQKAQDADQAEANALRGLADANDNVGASHVKLADSYNSLRDAQDQVQSSTRNLLEAQHALDLFNSARGQKERALALDALQRRVVTTPAESDQKQLDLLRLQDENASKKLNLEDAVSNATKSQRDALVGVQKAHQGILDAQKAERDAALKVTDAEHGVNKAIEARKKLRSDAAAQLKTDQLNEQQAIIKVVALLDTAAQKDELGNDYLKAQVVTLGQLAKSLGPNSELSKDIDAYLAKIKAAQSPPPAAPQKKNKFDAAGDQFANQGDPNYQKTHGGGGGTPASTPTGTTTTTLPGYASGGMVGGTLGTPQLAVVHGGERVLTPAQQRDGWGGVTIQQTNHFAKEGPSAADLEYANRQLGWQLTRAGRN